MTALWRLSNSQDLMPRARPAGRWHAAGAAVVVLDATPAAAVFARLAQAEVAHPRALPRNYFLLEVRVPAAAVAEPRPPAGWQTDLQASRAFGNAWLARGDTLLLKVPSAATWPVAFWPLTVSVTVSPVVNSPRTRPVMAMLVWAPSVALMTSSPAVPL